MDIIGNEIEIIPIHSDIYFLMRFCKINVKVKNNIIINTDLQSSTCIFYCIAMKNLHGTLYFRIIK